VAPTPDQQTFDPLSAVRALATSSEAAATGLVSNGQQGRVATSVACLLAGSLKARVYRLRRAVR
jgi:hypothetical protein